MAMQAQKIVRGIAAIDLARRLDLEIRIFDDDTETEWAELSIDEAWAVVAEHGALLHVFVPAGTRVKVEAEDSFDPGEPD